MSTKVMSSDRARTHWREVLDNASSGEDVVIERYGKRTAAVIAYEDFEALQEELEDLRAARRAIEVYEAWKRDRSIARPYSEIRAELVEEGLLDEQSEVAMDDLPREATGETTQE